MNFQTKVYVGNLPENCNLEAFRSLFEKHGKVVECDIVKNYGFVHFADGEDAKSAVDALNDTKWDGVTLKVELSYSQVRHKPGMGNKSVCYRCGKSGHWSKDCPRGRSRNPSLNNNNNNNNDHSNKSENRGQFLRGNRGPYMNGGSSGSSGSFLQSSLLGGPNGYRNDSFRDSYREPLSSSSSSSLYYERNSNAYSSNNSSSHYHNSGSSNSGRRNNNNNNTYIDLSRDLDREHSQNDPYYDSYPPPPPPPTRYRPYPSAYERRAPLPPLTGTSESMIPSLLSSLSPLSQYNHNNNSHNNNNSSSHHDLDPYIRPPPEYYERRREVLLRMPNRRGDWGE